jgi:rhamnosyltransferase
MKRDQKDISIVIPVKNGEDTLADCLDGIFTQKHDYSVEVIIIDSGSTDKTLDILENYNVKVHHLDPQKFNHGATRNLGVSLSSAPFVVFTVQDAIPASNTWLKTLMNHFDHDHVAAICGQQIVREDINRNPLQWFRPSGNPEVLFVQESRFDMLPANDQLRLCHWDNVNAAYRRSALQEIPFDTVSFGEDMTWAKKALSSGKTLVYDYRSRVVHYHHQNFRFYFKRQFIINHLVHSLFGVNMKNNNPLMEIIRNTFRIMKIPLPLRDKFKWSMYNLNLSLAKQAAAISFRSLQLFHGKRGPEIGLRRFCNTVPQGVQD